MNPRKKCLKELSRLNFVLKQHGRKHDKYYNEELNYSVTVKRSNFDEDDMRYILQEINRERARQGK